LGWCSASQQFLAASGLLPTGENNLYLVDGTTGHATQFSEVQDAYRSPDCSPDNRWLTFTVSPNEVWAYEVGTRQLNLISQGEGAAWSPSSDQLAVYIGSTVAPLPADPQIRFVTTSGELLDSINLGPIGTIRRALSEGKPPLDAHEFLQGISWSPRTGQVAFSIYTIIQDADNTYEAFLLDTTSGKVTAFLSGHDVGPLAWSPDGSYLAYLDDSESSWGKLTIADSAGECLFIPDIPPSVLDIAWSQDGAHLAFIFQHSIYTIDVAASLARSSPGEGCP